MADGIAGPTHLHNGVERYSKAAQTVDQTRSCDAGRRCRKDARLADSRRAPGAVGGI